MSIDETGTGSGPDPTGEVNDSPVVAGESGGSGESDVAGEPDVPGESDDSGTPDVPEELSRRARELAERARRLSQRGEKLVAPPTGGSDGKDDWTVGMSDRYRVLFERGLKLDQQFAASVSGTGAGAGAGTGAGTGDLTDDERWMVRAIDAAEQVRSRTSPNPWVGAVVVPAETDGETDGEAGGADFFIGVTAPAGGDHAEVAALAAAGNRAAEGTLYVTLEPCAHHGRTPPCTDAIVAASIRRVVVGMEDPDRLVAGAGITALIDAGLDVVVGVGAETVADQLAPYTCHRLTGRPWVVLKLAATLDGRTAAPDGTSQWLTGEAARADAHRLRSRSDAVLVGAGTVRLDDPELTVRLPDGDPDARPLDQQPLRVVLGRASIAAKVHPALELEGDLGDVLDDLGRRGIIQLLVEGGPTVAHAFHAAGLVDQYVIYLAPALFGGDDALPLFAGPGASTLSALWRGSVRSVTSLGGDLRVELSARQRPGPDGPDRVPGPTGHEASTAGSVDHPVDDRSGQE